MDEAGHVDIAKHVRVYLYVFAALAVLTVVTVGVAYFDLPIIPALILALAIAFLKGGLVAAFFMHLSSEKRIIFIFLIITAAFLIGMFALMLTTQADQEMVTSVFSLGGGSFVT